MLVSAGIPARTEIAVSARPFARWCKALEKITKYGNKGFGHSFRRSSTTHALLCTYFSFELARGLQFVWISHPPNLRRRISSG